MLIESVSGVRGIFPSHLNGPLVKRYGLAFHRLCDPGPLVIGRDTRRSGSKLVSALFEAYETSGREIRDCGICPTPTVQFAVEDTDAAGGIVVTASHNPGEWNGLKFIGRDGCFLNRHEFERLLKLFEENRAPSGSGAGTYSRFDQAVRRHANRIVETEWMDLEKIRKRRFSIAVDAVNGAASQALPILLDRLGCQVTKLNCDASGDFSRPPEPLPSSLGKLGETVVEHHCDGGFATDPDGDRLAVVDERGRPLGDEQTLVLAVDDFLRYAPSPQTVVTNLSTTQAVDRVAERHGATVARTAVGEINVVEQMKKLEASIGGEGNGGVILREIHLGRDSLVAAALVLHRMSSQSQPLSAIVENLPRYVMIKERISLGDTDPEEILRVVSESFPDVQQNTDDGLKLVWPEKWIHVRRSNTEPIIRIYAEAPTEREANELVDTVKDKIKDER